MLLLQFVTSDHTVEWDIVCRHTRDMSCVLLRPKPWPLPQMRDGGKLPPPEEPVSPTTSLRGLLPKSKEVGPWESSKMPGLFPLGTESDQGLSRNLGPSAQILMLGSLGFGLRFGSTTPKWPSLYGYECTHL